MTPTTKLKFSKSYRASLGYPKGVVGVQGKNCFCKKKIKKTKKVIFYQLFDPEDYQRILKSFYKTNCYATKSNPKRTIL